MLYKRLDESEALIWGTTSLNFTDKFVLPQEHGESSKEEQDLGDVFHAYEITWLEVP